MNYLLKSPSRTQGFPDTHVLLGIPAINRNFRQHGLITVKRAVIGLFDLVLANNRAGITSELVITARTVFTAHNISFFLAS